MCVSRVPRVSWVCNGRVGRRVSTGRGGSVGGRGCECHVGGARCGCAVGVQWVCNGCAVGVWGAECVQRVVGVCECVCVTCVMGVQWVCMERSVCSAWWECGVFMCHVCHVCHGCAMDVQWACGVLSVCSAWWECVSVCVSRVSRASWVCNGRAKAWWESEGVSHACGGCVMDVQWAC